MLRHRTDGAGKSNEMQRGLVKLAAASAVAASIAGMSMPAVRAADANDTIANWPAEAQKAAMGMMKIHGAPDETTSTMLVWHNSGPWKRIIASNTVTPHDFPGPHPDSVEQFVSYPGQSH